MTRLSRLGGRHNFVSPLCRLLGYHYLLSCHLFFKLLRVRLPYTFDRRMRRGGWGESCSLRLLPREDETGGWGESCTCPAPRTVRRGMMLDRAVTAWTKSVVSASLLCGESPHDILEGS